MSQRIPITIRLESFEGPLDLLLYLIQTHELDISKVSLYKITDQYLQYVLLMQELNFDIASEFLVMAATLIHWKSRALLPREEQVEDNTETEVDVLNPQILLDQLREHQRFKRLGEILSGRPLLGQDVFIRANGRPPIQKLWKEMSLSALTLVYQDTVVRSRKRTHVLQKETVSIADKIAQFKEILVLFKRISLVKLIVHKKSWESWGSQARGQFRTETVATFMAILELSRLKKTKLYQEATYSDIYIELISSLEDFDLSLASSLDLEYSSKISIPPLEKENSSLMPELNENT